MKTFSAELIAEKAAGHVAVYRLVKIGNYCYTNCDQSVLYNGDEYLPSPLEISDLVFSDAGSSDGTQVRVGNVTLEMSSLILNNALKDVLVTLYEAWLVKASLPTIEILGVEEFPLGKVDGRPGIDEHWATIQASPQNIIGAVTPRRRIDRSCGWIPGDADCALAAAIGACKKTFEACTALLNTARFGGFRHLPVRGTKFTWGNSVITIK